MSYSDTYGFLVKGKKDLTGIVESSAGSYTAIPPDVSIIRPDMLKNMYESEAGKSGKNPQEVSEASVISALKLIDKR